MARSFNGTTNVATLSNLASTTDFTVACWINPVTNTANDSTYWWENFPTTPRNNVGFTPRNSAGSPGQQWECYVGGTGGTALDTGGGSATGTWIPVAFTRSGTTGKGYVSGTQLGSNITVGSGSFTPQNVRIGAHFFSGVNNQFLNANIAEWAVWSVALTADEIAALAHRESPRRVRPGSLVAYLPLWGLQSPEPDLSGGANNGTLTGTARANHAPVRPFTWTRSHYGPDATSGTTYPQAVAGSLTPSGAVQFRVLKDLAGSVAPSGALAKVAAKALVGSLTPTGALANRPAKAIAGSVTATGSVTRSMSKALVGSLPPSGALAKQSNKALSGSLTATGAIANQANKVLAGSLTATGSLANQSVKLKSLSGSLAPAGALANQSHKVLSGSLAPAGALAKQVAKPVSGSVAPSGSLATQSVKLKTLSGSLAPSGAMAKVAIKVLSGSLTASGAAGRLVSKSLSGSVTATGLLAMRPAKALSGSLAASGALATQAIKVKALSGSLTASGALSRVTGKALGGSVSPDGSVTKVATKGLSGSVAPSGELAPRGSRFVALAGSLAATGALTVRSLGILPVIVVTFALRAFRSALFRLRSGRPAVTFSGPAVREVLFSGGRMTPSDARIKVGDVGTALVVQFLDGSGAVIDISAATVIQIKLLKPPVSGVSTLLTKTGVLYTDGTDGKARYSTLAGDLDVAGYWAIEGYVEVSGNQVTTDPETFPVFATIGNGGP